MSLLASGKEKLKLLKNGAVFLKQAVIYLLLCTGTFLMLRIIARYFAFEDNRGFLAVKQDYINNTFWKAAFYIHVFSSIFTLIAGFTQFSGFILRKYRNVHRRMGKLYAYDILLINFPAGMIIAFYANGHWPTRIAFIILDLLWFFFTYKGVRAVRMGDIISHRKFMIFSYALTFSAVTLRTWKLILANALNLPPLTLYMTDAWMGFVPNLLFAFWLTRKRKDSFLPYKPDTSSAPFRNTSNSYKCNSK